jgi:hypothetical protein
MQSGPPQIAEALVAILLPPACREEILGDLVERYRSPGQYVWDAAATIPLVIASRIRRTSDPQLVLMHALVLYLAFTGAAWLTDRGLLPAQWGLLRLAIPAPTGILGLLLDDAYAKPGYRSAWQLVRGPAVGIGLILFSQSVFWTGVPDFGLSRSTVFSGCAMSLLLCSAVRLMFRPEPTVHSANAPADWLKRTGQERPEPNAAPARRVAGIVMAVTMVSLWIAYEIYRRG